LNQYFAPTKKLQFATPTLVGVATTPTLVFRGLKAWHTVSTLKTSSEMLVKTVHFLSNFKNLHQ